jgi:hypothetical protein
MVVETSSTLLPALGGCLTGIHAAQQRKRSGALLSVYDLSEAQAQHVSPYAQATRAARRAIF